MAPYIHVFPDDKWYPGECHPCRVGATIGETWAPPNPFPSPQTQFHSSLKAGSQVLCEEMVVGDTPFIKQEEILLG